MERGKKRKVSLPEPIPPELLLKPGTFEGRSSDEEIALIMGFRLLSGETRRALSPSQALPMSAVDQVTSSSNFLSPFGLRRNAMSEGAIQSPTLAGSLTPPLARLPVTPPPRKPASGQEQGMNEEEDEGIGFSVSPPSPTCTMDVDHLDKDSGSNAKKKRTK